mgnify:CR=1 FL=1
MCLGAATAALSQVPPVPVHRKMPAKIMGVTIHKQSFNITFGGFPAFRRPLCTPLNGTGGETKMSRGDFTMGGIGGGRGNLGGLTHYDSNAHG